MCIREEIILNLKVVTHDGKFHPDEIFACVLLSWSHVGQLSFIRTRNQTSLERYKKSDQYYVIDVGDEHDPSKLNFDHHQATFNCVGENGDLLSSCGLMWKYLLEQPNFRETWNVTPFIEKKVTEFTIMVDRHDNGVEYAPELDFITMYNYANFDSKVRFKQAFRAAENYFFQKLTSWRIHEEQEKKEDIAINNAVNGIIFSEEKLSVSEKINGTPNYLLVCERSKDEYVIVSLNQFYEVDFSVRCPAPAEWSGLHEKDIKKFDKSLIFSHKNRFLTIVKGTKEDALRVANIIVENHLKTKKENALKFLEEMRNN